MLRQFHDLGVSRHLLLVATGECLDLDIGKKPFNLAVGELGSLDTSRRADAFDSRNPAQACDLRCHFTIHFSIQFHPISGIPCAAPIQDLFVRL
jgi:hypothetical protein